MKIRCATIDDYPALLPLFEQDDRFHRKSLPHWFRKPDGPARSREHVRKVIDGESDILVAEDDGVLIGLACVAEKHTPDVPLFVPLGFALVDEVVVDERHRRKGVGVALMEEAELWARRRGLAEVRLNVHSFNEGAIAFYEALGFEVSMLKMHRRLEPE